VKIRLAEAVHSLNVEHRTSNIERRILMMLRFIDFITSGSHNPPAEKIRSVVSFPAFVATSAKQAYAVFFLIDRIHYSMLNVRCSMFDVRRSSVSFQIRLAVFQASGWADTRHLSASVTNFTILLLDGLSPK